MFDRSNMEVSYYLVLVTSFLFLIHKLFIRNRVVRRNLPPSPPGLPIIGHYHLLKRPVHLTLLDLSKKYGPVLFLRFGSRPVLVISTPSVIEECFTKNDVTFANRPLLPLERLLNTISPRLWPVHMDTTGETFAVSLPLKFSHQHASKGLQASVPKKSTSWSNNCSRALSGKWKLSHSFTSWLLILWWS